MKRPHNRVHCSAPEKGIGKNQGVPVAPSSFLHQEYSRDKKVQNRFNHCGLWQAKSPGFSTSHCRGFYWASSSCPSRSLWVGDGEAYSAVSAGVVWGEQVALVSGCLGLLMNRSNTRILTNLLSCKCWCKCRCKMHLLASLFLSTLLSLLMQPPSCKARFYCRQNNRGGKCLVFNALLFQLHDCCFKCWMSSYCWQYQVREALVWALPGWDQ